jgi:hypothetical protein
VSTTEGRILEELVFTSQETIEQIIAKLRLTGDATDLSPEDFGNMDTVMT